MTIMELMNQLKEIHAAHGDIEVILATDDFYAFHIEYDENCDEVYIIEGEE